MHQSCIAAFDLEHLTLFELFQPRMRQVERDGDTADAVGREPLVGQPVVRAEDELPLRELAVQGVDAFLELAAFDGQRRGRTCGRPAAVRPAACASPGRAA